MAKIVLLHGFGTGYPTFNGFDEYYQFSGFKDLIDKKKAAIFKWYNGPVYPLWRKFDPFEAYVGYRRERAATKNKKNLLALHRFLLKEKPELLICHSLGCMLFLEYLKVHDLPSHVRRVVFVQSDADRNFKIKNPTCLSSIEKKHIILENYFCPWDNALLTSAIINGYMPAGLFGTFDRSFRNIVTSFYANINFHIGTISSKKFVKKALKPHH